MPTGYSWLPPAVWPSPWRPRNPPFCAEGPITTFGVTVVDPFGLRGEIYLLPPGYRYGFPNSKN